MEKYLKKSAKQLKQEMLEMTQALEKIREDKIRVYGEIFLSIVESIDDAKRAEAYFKILDTNASKAQKKILVDDIEDLKELAGIYNKPAVKVTPSNSPNSEDMTMANSTNSQSDASTVDKQFNNIGVGNG